MNFIKKLFIAIYDFFFAVIYLDPEKVYVYYDKIEGNEAQGTLYFGRMSCKFISGRWGKGAAPLGEYEATLYKSEFREAFIQFGVGFQIPITPVFKTDRTFLAIHPDGNVLGTLGCIGLIFENKIHGIMMRNLFKDWFITCDTLYVEILKRNKIKTED